MMHSVVRGLLYSTLLLSVPTAWGQKWNQPYTVPRGAHESRVISCTNPNPQTSWRIAADDFVCPTTSTIVRVCWFGIVSSPAQLNPPPAGALPRQYVIRIYNEVNCKPANLLATWCVTPSNTQWSTDCRQRRVYRFSAPLLPVFTAAGGVKYWIQISENDARSLTLNAEDFRWSGHRPTAAAPHVLCPAAQHLGPVLIPPTPWNCPIFDDCNPPVEDDLAFCLYRKTIIGVIGIIASPAVFNLQLLSPTPTGQPDLVETMCVRTDDDGSYAVEPDAPPGNYEVMMTGMGVRPLHGMVSIQEGSEAPLSFFDIFYGDLNVDDHVDLMDYRLLQNSLTGP